MNLAEMCGIGNNDQRIGNTSCGERGDGAFNSNATQRTQEVSSTSQNVLSIPIQNSQSLHSSPTHHHLRSTSHHLSAPSLPHHVKQLSTPTKSLIPTSMTAAGITTPIGGLGVTGVTGVTTPHSLAASSSLATTPSAAATAAAIIARSASPAPSKISGASAADALLRSTLATRSLTPADLFHHRSATPTADFLRATPTSMVEFKASAASRRDSAPGDVFAAMAAAAPSPGST